MKKFAGRIRELTTRPNPQPKGSITVVNDTTNFRGYIREQHPWKWSKYWYRKTTCRGASKIKLKATAGGNMWLTLISSYAWSYLETYITNNLWKMSQNGMRQCHSELSVINQTFIFHTCHVPYKMSNFTSIIFR